MKIRGREVDPAIIAKVTAELKARGDFSVGVAEILLIRAGVSSDKIVSYPTAQRLLQDLKKKGLVEFVDRKLHAPWRWKE